MSAPGGAGGPGGTPFTRASERLAGWMNAVADLGDEADREKGGPAPAGRRASTGAGAASDGARVGDPAAAAADAPAGAGEEAVAEQAGGEQAGGEQVSGADVGSEDPAGQPNMVIGPDGGGDEEVDGDLETAAAAAEIEVDLQVAAIARQRDEYLNALRHLQADFENYRKRVDKQRVEHIERATGEMVTKLLPVCDTVDLAIAHGGGEEVKQVWTALFDTLERLGLVRIDPAGVPFDPTMHDAVAHEPGDSAGVPEVVEVLRAGYLWKGRVLRPAMVKVRG